MQEIQATHPGPLAPEKTGWRFSGRWVFLGSAALALALLAVLPPLIGVNRYQRRISTSIGASLGRPVHFDQVTLNLLPLPSFTITNFVVEEDPPFGAEPIIRANTVTATLRVSSLWRRRVEFSRISFDSPSLNLVHDSRGKWNMEGILLQASQIQTAPTAQRSPGSHPRFPYIEATGARLNLKENFEKTPFSLSEADFALWQPDPQQWRMRIKGRPVRTDTNVSDTGSLQVEATLGRSGALTSVPLELEAAWRDAPLGEATRLVFARDLGLRGDITLNTTVRGTLDRNTFVVRFQGSRLRRSEFVPQQTLSLDVQCDGTTVRLFHAVPDIRCSWPVPDSDGSLLALAGSLPDLQQLGSANVEIGVSRLPASVLLNWLRVASSRVPPGLSASGLLSGSLSHDPDAEGSAWSGQATLPELRLSGAQLSATPLVVESLFFHSDPPGDTGALGPHLPPTAGAVLLAPATLSLGGKDPAGFEARADRTGYTLHLSGTVAPGRLLAVANALPQLGDGLIDALPSASRAAGTLHVDLTAHRSWGGAQTWTDNQVVPTPRAPSRGRRSHRTATF